MLSRILDAINTYSLFFTLWLLFVTLLYISLRLRSITKGREKFIYVIIPYVLYIFIVVCRDISDNTGGIDAVNYMKIFEWADMPLGDYIAFRKEEVGYLLLNWIIYRIIPNVWVFFAVIHTIAFALCYKLLSGIKIRRSFLGWMFVFLYSAPLFTMFNTVRMGVCVYLGLYALKYCNNLQFRKAVLFALGATLFHNSALILFVTIILLYAKQRLLSNNMFHIVVGAAFIVIGASMYILKRNPVISIYRTYSTFKEGSIAAGVFLITLLTTMFLGKIKDDKRFKNAYYIIETAILILAINLSFSIAYRMYLIYLPLIYHIIYTYAPEMIRVNNIQYISVKKVLIYLMTLVFLAEVFKTLFIGVPDGLNGFALRF